MRAPIIQSISIPMLKKYSADLIFREFLVFMTDIFIFVRDFKNVGDDTFSQKIIHYNFCRLYFNKIIT